MADFPTITGTHDSYTTDGKPISAFTGVTVSDPVAGATDTLQFFGVPDGQLSEGVGYTGPHTLSFVNGFYQITGTAAQVTAELDALSFTPQSPTAGRTTVDTPNLMLNSSSHFYAGDPGTHVYDTTQPDSVSLSPRVTYRDGVFTLTGAVSTALGVTGVGLDGIVDGVPTHLGDATVDANGNFTFADRVGPHTQGFVTAVTLNQGDGEYNSAMDIAPFSLTGGLRQGAYRAEQDSYTADGSTETSTTLFRADGGRRVDVLAAGQTFSSDHSDVWNDGGMPETTFVFDPGYGHDAIKLFRADGADHDALSFKGSDFGADPASQLAGVLANTHFEKGGVVITDPATQETVKLFGVSRQQFVADQRDITFHA